MAEDSESAASQQSLELDDQDTCGIDGDNEEEAEHSRGSPCGDLGAKKKKKKQKRKKEKPNSGGTKSDSASDSQEIRIQPPSKNPAVPRQKHQDSPRAMGLLPACPSPARNIDEAARHGDQFWHTQPAPTLSELVACRGTIEAVRDSVRQGPSLPQGLTDTPDLGDANVLRALYRLLSGKHAAAKDCPIRFDCSPQFLLSVKRVVESNFLCAHQKLTRRWVIPVRIREITRGGKLEGILQAICAAGVVLLNSMATLRCWHHSLNPRKLVEVRFSHMSRNTTLQRALKPCRLPANTSGKLTDFLSFYMLPLMTVLRHLVPRSLQVACSFIIHTETPLLAFVSHTLSIAKSKGVDVFSTLDLMEDKTFLEKLKFGIGDGSLQYDLYNWGCPGTESGKVGLVLQ